VCAALGNTDFLQVKVLLKPILHNVHFGKDCNALLCHERTRHFYPVGPNPMVCMFRCKAIPTVKIRLHAEQKVSYIHRF